MANKPRNRRPVCSMAADLPLRGVYVKIARELGVHPSYVSRVARGERRSDAVMNALYREFTSLSGQMANMLTAYFGECPPDNWLALVNIHVAVGIGSTRDDALRHARANGHINPDIICITPDTDARA
jgi:hypothetical protein